MLDADALSAALTTALERSAGYRRNEAANRFCQYHTVDNQKAHWVHEIGHELELPLGALPIDLIGNGRWMRPSEAIRANERERPHDIMAIIHLPGSSPGCGAGERSKLVFLHDSFGDSAASAWYSFFS